jgi:uncharacterized protein
VNVEVKVRSLGLDRTTNSPVVILGEVEGDRVVPIWIGPAEASAIAMHLAEMKFSRPLTHDLLVSVLKGLGGRLERVVISRVTDATYYAEMVLVRGEERITVDARPSDSIAVALRAGARILAHESLLERASLSLSEEGLVGEDDLPGTGSASGFSAGASSGASPGSPSDPTGTGGDPSPGESGTRPMDAEELKDYLRRMNPEDFGRFTP